MYVDAERRFEDLEKVGFGIVHMKGVRLRRAGGHRNQRSFMTSQRSKLSGPSMLRTPLIGIQIF